MYNMRDSTPQPRLLYSGGSVYVDTHVGVLARLDAESGTLEWGYGYKTDPLQAQSRFFYYYQPQEPQAASSTPLTMGEAFLVKGLQSERLYAVDPNRMKVLWERPITKSSRLLGVDDRAIYFGGSELSALDLKTRQLLWATRLPGGSLEGRVLVRPDGLWQLTPRGIFEIDPRSGAVRRIFRGKDLGASWGDLALTDRWLLAVSNRTISAYPRRASGDGDVQSWRPCDLQRKGFEMMRSSELPRGVEFHKSAVAAIVLAVVMLAPGRPSRAQFFDGHGESVPREQNIEGFTVTGKGHAAAKPDLVEIDLEVSASSELTADAIVKYRDAKKRIRDAFAALKLANVAVDERGLLVDQKGQMQNSYYFDYQPNTRTKTEVQLSRKLVVKASDIRKMDEESVLQLVGRLLDVAQDAGANVGAANNYSPYYYYRYGRQPQRRAWSGSCSRTSTSCRRKLTRRRSPMRAPGPSGWPGLSHVELGPIVAVREIAVPGDRSSGSDEEAPRKRLETGEVPGDPRPRGAAGSLRGPSQG